MKPRPLFSVFYMFFVSNGNFSRFLFDFTATSVKCRMAAVKILPYFTTAYFKFYLSQRITKPTKWHVCPAKTQISLGIRPVISESSKSTERTVKTDQTGRMPRLI